MANDPGKGDAGAVSAKTAVPTQQRGVADRGLSGAEAPRERAAVPPHIWRFRRPDGSTYERSWTGPRTEAKARAFATKNGHRLLGDVIPGPTVEGTPLPVDRPPAPPQVVNAPPEALDPRGTANRLWAPVGNRVVPPPAPPPPPPKDPQGAASVFTAPDHIADRLWKAERDRDQALLFLTEGGLRRLVGSNSVEPPGRPGVKLPPALAVGALVIGAYAGLAYIAVSQGNTFEARTRRRMFGQRLVDEGQITRAEFEEYVRSGNLPDKVAHHVALHILAERGDVDLWGVISKGVTATGQPRDARTFWQLYREQKKDLGLSKANIERISRRRSPIVDKEWTAAYPEHFGFEGRRLEHHHLEGTSIATPVPDLLHDWFSRILHQYLH